jgi:hypothetical protein
LLKHTDTLSKWRAMSRAGTPEATAALNSRAPSRWAASPRRRASAVAASTYAGGSTCPPQVFSSASSRVRAKCASSGLMAASISASAIVPSARCASGCGWMLPSTAAPPAFPAVGVGHLADDVFVAAAAVRHQRAQVALRAGGHEQRGLLPSSRRRCAACSALTVGSSPKTSSPSSGRHASRRASPRRRAGDGVAAQVDRLHVAAG